MENAQEARIQHGKAVVAEQIEYFVSQFGDVASEWKYDGSRVTEADIHLSHVFADALLEAFPEDQFFSEELDHGEKPISVRKGYSWLLDPIDGTNNFARRIATCSISLALMKDGDPIYGYVYDYASKQLIHGGAEYGLWLGEKKVERMENEISGHSLVSTQTLADEEAANDDNALRYAFKLRCFGSSAIHMAHAALGWTDGVIAHRVKAWDIAGGMPLLKAVGGSTRFFDTKVFPMTEFSSKAEGFAHIAGTVEMCEAIEKTIGRDCKYSW